LGLTQQRMADELGTRQQTISEWETGMYRPRGASSRLLTIIAERAGFDYEAKGNMDIDKGTPVSEAQTQSETCEPYRHQGT